MDIREIFGEQGDSKICSQKERVVGPLQQIDQRIPVFCTCTGGLIGRNDSLSKIHDECYALCLVNSVMELIVQNRAYSYRIFWKPPGMLGTCIGVESAQSSAEIFS